MAFIYEKLNEQDKEFVAAFKFPRPLASYSLARPPYHWVSDREHGIYLVNLGGQGHMFEQEYPPNFYRLIWNGQPIKIEGRVVEQGNKEATSVSIAIERIVAPLSLKVSIEDVLVETIKCAFEAYARRRGDEVNIVSIDFVKFGRPNFIKGDINNG